MHCWCIKSITPVASHVAAGKGDFLNIKDLIVQEACCMIDSLKNEFPHDCPLGIDIIYMS